MVVVDQPVDEVVASHVQLDATVPPAMPVQRRPERSLEYLDKAMGLPTRWQELQQVLHKLTSKQLQVLDRPATHRVEGIVAQASTAPHVHVPGQHLWEALQSELKGAAQALRSCGAVAAVSRASSTRGAAQRCAEECMQVRYASSVVHAARAAGQPIQGRIPRVAPANSSIPRIHRDPAVEPSNNLGPAVVARCETVRAKQAPLQ
mmetsp:Transcript_88654/g.284626  ORF Transcript_88654/g.284626 Transcript_88654/m.284626 type:complete len:205 (-) Transcript_88654:301-915(-)